MSLQRLERLIGRLQGLRFFLEANADIILKNTGKVLVDENRRVLREEGHTTEGLPIEYQKTRIGQTGRYGWYSKGYEKHKSDKGRNVLYVDLFLSGEFHKSIVLIQTEKNNWIFSSSDEKYLFLLANYGQDILGVSKEFLDLYASGIMEFQLQGRVDKFLTV